jgi:hypothetical protein
MALDRAFIFRKKAAAAKKAKSHQRRKLLFHGDVKLLRRLYISQVRAAHSERTIAAY